MMAARADLARPATGRIRLPALFAAGMLFLAACAGDPPTPSVPQPPPPRPERLEGQPSQAELRRIRAERNRAVNTEAAVAAEQASASSHAMRLHYARVEQTLIANARLRRDRVPMDAPIDAETLSRNFIAIALRDEYSRDGGTVTASGAPAPLRRWQAPVRLQLEFGASANQPYRNTTRGEAVAFAARLQQASGHSVRLVDSGGNFVVLFLTEDERIAIGPRLRDLVPGIPDPDVDNIRDLSRENTCAVFAYSQGAAPVYSRAVAIIRAELPTLLRSSCIHEEIAQGMGLANDSPAARPSIFNDDEEFALLTRHDELLLQILYDRRLRPGMTEAEAAPIVRRIAAELLGGET